MTVQSTAYIISHRATTGQSTYDYDFLILSEEHVNVFLAGHIYTSGYSVSGIGDHDGGTVTLDTPIGSDNDGDILSIVRLVPATQELDYTSYDGFPAESHERGLDKLTMLVQQALGTTSGSVRIPPSEDPTVVNTILPQIIERAQKFLFFDSQGNVTVSDGSVEGGGGVQEIKIALPSDELIYVDPSDINVPEIGVRPWNDRRRLMVLTDNNENRPGSPGGGIPLFVLSKTPELIFAVFVDAGDYQPGTDSTEMLTTLRQAGGEVGFVESIAVNTPNKARHLVQLDSFGQIPDDLINFVGIRNRGVFRGDDLCPKNLDDQTACIDPDTRNPTQRWPNLDPDNPHDPDNPIAQFRPGDFMTIVMAPGEIEGTMFLWHQVSDGDSGYVWEQSITTVEPNDGIVWLPEIVDPVDGVTIYFQEGWYHRPGMFDLSSADLVAYNDLGNDVIFGHNVQIAIDNVDSYLNALTAEQVRYPVGGGVIIQPGTGDVLQALIDLDAGAMPKGGGTIDGDVHITGRVTVGGSNPPTSDNELCPRLFVNTKAPLASPAFTNYPTAPTMPSTDSSDRLATTAFVKSVAGGGEGDSFPAGTRMVFVQASAPTGWNIQTTYNDRIMRIVSTSAGAVGGSHDPILMDKVPSHVHTMSGSTNASGIHGHSIKTNNHVNGNPPYLGGQYLGRSDSTNQEVLETIMESGSHTHTLSGTIGNNTGALNWLPKYVDVLVGQKV